MGKGAGGCLSTPATAEPASQPTPAPAPKAAPAPVAAPKQPNMVKIAIIYYSTYGHVRTLAQVRASNDPLERPTALACTPRQPRHQPLS